MSTPKETKVWPLWGRVLFWVLFAAVIAGGVFATVAKGHLSWAVVRVVLIVVLVPGLALLFATAVQRRRIQRTTQRLGLHLQQLGAAIEDEQRLPVGERASGADDDSLRAAAGAVHESGTGPEHVAHARSTLEAAASSWRSGSTLEQAAERALRGLRRLDSQQKVLEHQEKAR